MRDNIKNIIETVVRDRLAGTSIIEIHVKDDLDFEGDPILRVTVVFDPKGGVPDSHRMLGLARHLRSKLDAENAFSHPVFRFLSQSDAKRITAAAA